MDFSAGLASNACIDMAVLVLLLLSLSEHLTIEQSVSDPSMLSWLHCPKISAGLAQAKENPNALSFACTFLSECVPWREKPDRTAIEGSPNIRPTAIPLIPNHSFERSRLHEGSYSPSVTF